VAFQFLSPKAITQPYRRNQRDIVGGVVMALNNLVGWGWGQYGEAIFFIQRAYRNAGNDLKTFK